MRAMIGPVELTDEVWCAGCERFKKPSEFYNRWDAAPYRRSRCKECYRAIEAERQRNPTKYGAQIDRTIAKRQASHA